MAAKHSSSGGGKTPPSEREEMDEETRLAERARRIWGDSPFSPEAMAADAAAKAAERESLTARERYRTMQDLEEQGEQTT